MKAPTANPENGTSLRPKSDEPLPNVLSVYWCPGDIDIRLDNVPGRTKCKVGPILTIGSSRYSAARKIQEAIAENFGGRLELLACCKSSND